MAPIISAAMRKKIKDTLKSPTACMHLGKIDTLFDVADIAKAQLNTVWTFHVRIPLKLGSLPAMQALLDVGDVLEKHYPGIHFARIALVPRAGQLSPTETHLVLAVTFDQARELAINFLVENAAKLEPVLRLCDAYVNDSAKDPVALSAYLTPREELVRLFYVKYRWPQQVIEESLQLRARFLKLVRDWEMDPDTAGKDDRLVYTYHDFVVETQKPHSPALAPPVVPVFDPHATNTLNMVHPLKPGIVDLAALLASSTIPPQVMALVSTPGVPLSNVLLFKLILAWGQTQVHCCRKDSLAKLKTLHFARISLIDEASAPKMLFGSVFDGDLEQYMIDFGTRVEREINMLWGLCQGYPANGCADLDAFRAWLESGRVDAPVFHLGHSPATVRQIEQSTELREELLKFVAVSPFKPGQLPSRLRKFIEKHRALLT